MNNYIKEYLSPLGTIYLTSNGEYLTGLWFKDSKDTLKHHGNFKKKDLPIFRETIKWLDIYFSGNIPNFTPKYKIDNLTTFRKLVIDIMNKIPYGEVITYNDIAKEIAKKRKITKMSAQAVGGAVGWNPICIIIPCHRVVGANGNLTGYGGGIHNKIKLLKIEKNDMSKFSLPKINSLMTRCPWCNLNNPKYIDYHDYEWGVLNLDDIYLLEMLILEMFQAGLSWECVLNKREAFRDAYDDFDIDKICNYTEDKIKELEGNKDIIRNKLKIKASINNTKIFKDIKEEYGSFKKYLLTFTNNKIYYEINMASSELSDKISKDLRKRGMTFVGTMIIYSYLQAIGIIYSHDMNCYLYKEESNENS